MDRALVSNSQSDLIDRSQATLNHASFVANHIMRETTKSLASYYEVNVDPSNPTTLISGNMDLYNHLIENLQIERAYYETP